MSVAAGATPAEPAWAEPSTVRDPVIVDGLRTGDAHALERLFLRYGRLIRHWAKTEGHEADDLVQDVLLNVWRSGPRLRPDTDLPSFLKTVTMNAIRNRWRSKDRRPVVPVGLETASAGTADPTATRTERLAIEQVMGALSDRERACLSLLYLADLPLAEVAARLGTSHEAAKSLAARARRRLRAELTNQEQRDRSAARRRSRAAAIISATAIVLAVAGLTFDRGDAVGPAPGPVAADVTDTQTASTDTTAPKSVRTSTAPATTAPAPDIAGPTVASGAPAADTDPPGNDDEDEHGGEPCSVPAVPFTAALSAVESVTSVPTPTCGSAR